MRKYVQDDKIKEMMVDLTVLPPGTACFIMMDYKIKQNPIFYKENTS